MTLGSSAEQPRSLDRRLAGLSETKKALLEAKLLARAGQRSDRTSSGPAAPTDQPGDQRRSWPLSFAQQQVWLREQLTPGSPINNMSSAVRLRGPLDIGALRAAHQGLVARHEPLRTTIEPGDGEPMQVIGRPRTLSVPVVDLSTLNGLDQGRRIEQIVDAQVSRPFELASELMLRATVIRLAEDDHLLVQTGHHIATDGWSVGLMAGDLSSLYAAAVRGQDPLDAGLPRLPLAYREFAVWQRQLPRRPGYQFLVDDWRRELAGAPALLSLPSDYTRPPTPTWRGASVALRLPNDLVNGLRALGRDESATLYMVLLACLSLLLSRFSGQDDVVIGSPTSGRSRVETERLVGCFMNTIALRTDLSGQPTFRQLLARVRDVCRAAYSRADVPFQQVVEAVRPARTTSYSPIFQVLFTLQNTPREALALPGIHVERYPLATRSAELDLSFVMQETPGGIDINAEYSCDLFERGTVERLLSHYRMLVANVLNHTDDPIDRLPLLTAPDRRQVVVEWNQTRTDAPPEHCIQDLFEAQVERTPDAVAVSDQHRRLTYAQLNADANRLAHYLRESGVGPETLVGVSLDRSTDLLVGLLGVLKAGGAYVPLDPTHPKERLAFVLAETQAQVLVTHTDVLGQLPDFSGRAVCLDTEWPLIARQPASAPTRVVDSDNLAYVLYTSGSTGAPKGVMVAHRSVVNLLCSMARQIGMGQHDVLFAVTTLSFDIAALELFMPLIVGARVALASQAALGEGARLIRELESSRATIMQATPSLWRLLLFAGWQGDRALTVLCGGEALPRDLANQLAERSAAVWNLYGPTETTIWVTADRIERSDEPISIGRPIDNTQLYILDPHLEPVPVGVPGEVFIGGVNVARGYLKRPELTAERFVADPFSASPGARLYRTGDLGRYRADGKVVLLGRMDEQLKVRGFRVEPGEVETALTRHPAVRNAAVVLHGETPIDQHLVAYIVPRPDVEAPTPAELRALLGQHVPDYMIPDRFELIERLPLTANGKLDRRVLRELAALQSSESSRDAEREQSHEPPRTSEEAILARIWEQVLGAPCIGVRDNFFDLGGHSLLATRLVSRLRDEFQVDLPVRTLFDAPTIELLAQRVVSERATGRHNGGVPLRSVPRSGELPLSFAQQRLWFFEQLEPGTATYHIPYAARVRGPLDVTMLTSSLREVVRRHESLRTAISVHDGQPAQVVTEAASVDLPLVDLQGLPIGNREPEALRLAREDVDRPFDFATGPLFRARLFRLAEQDHLLVLTLHHIICDGWSRDLLLRELGLLYDAYSRGERSPLPELPIQYADYAVWQRASLHDAALEGQLSFWRDTLADLPILQLPLDHPRPATQSYRGASVSLVLDRELVRGLKEFGRSESASLFMLLLAGFQAVLGRLAGQDDIAVGTPIAGRTRPELEGLIGVFVNSLIVRTSLAGDPTFRELVGRVRDMCLGAYAHQDIPFERLVDELKPERDLSRHPLFQVMFNLLSFADTDGLAVLPGLTVEPVALGEPPSKLDLTLYGVERDDEVALKLVYRPDLFEADRMLDLVEQLRAFLQSVVQQPDERIGHVSLVTGAARTRLPDPTAPLSDAWPGSVQDIFSSLARTWPHRSAIADAAEHWTYAELEQRSNQLAHALREGGVRRGDVVAVYAARSARLAWAILGILKTGGAFLVLDPAYPVARTIDYVRIARPRAWLTVTDASPPATLLDHLDAAGVGFRLHLPSRSVAVATGWLEDRPTDPPGGDACVGPDDLACIGFTSGSTGTPKAVVGRHGSLSHFIPWQRDAFGLSEADRYSMVSGLAHDPLQRDLFTPLQTGASIRVPSADDLLTPGWMSRWMRDLEVTVANLTPAMLQVLLQPAPGATSPTPMPALRHVFVIGDNLLQRDVQRLRACAPHARCTNLYGSTETQRALSFFPVPTGASAVRRPPSRAVVPLGRGMRDVQLLVLNRANQQAGVGELGEICVRSPHLAAGYLDEPELTALKFIVNPFTRLEQDRMYRTGDLGRYLPDGDVEALGRIDDQVQVRGYRVEPAEIEALLNSAPGVGAACVVAREVDEADRRLVAYVVPVTDHGPVPSAGELRRFLRDRLPEYMVPSTFVRLSALPLTPNGKVDRQTLPSPHVTRSSDEQGFVAPRTEIEIALASIWSELLGRERVGIRDNFFDLGGDSLLVVRLFARIGERLGATLPISTLFPDATIEHLAQALHVGGRRTPTRSLVPIQPRGDRLPLFCVHPIDGEVVRYVQLARALGDQQPVYGLRARGLDGEDEPFGDISAMAAYYVSEMRSVWPGPYQVAGFSSGGVIAMEIANQLHALGQDVRLLAIIDTTAFHSTPLARKLRGLPADLAAYVRHALEPGQRLRFVWRQLPAIGRFAAWAIGARRELPYRQRLESLVAGIAEESGPHYRVAQLQLRALARFSPRPFRGRVTLFRARVRPLLATHDPTLGWDELACDGVDVCPIPGEHATMFDEPYVHELARQLTRHLASTAASRCPLSTREEPAT